MTEFQGSKGESLGETTRRGGSLTERDGAVRVVSCPALPGSRRCIGGQAAADGVTNGPLVGRVGSSASGGRGNGDGYRRGHGTMRSGSGVQTNRILSGAGDMRAIWCP